MKLIYTEIAELPSDYVTHILKVDGTGVWEQLGVGPFAFETRRIAKQGVW